MNAASNAPQVTVIIPTFNRGILLERSIRSVLAQSFTDFDVIVVDDASNDDTEQRVRAINDPRICYIRHQAKRGAAAARNTGIACARGHFIAFQDSDDIWLTGKLEKQMELMKTHEDSSTIVYSGFVRWSHDEATYIPQPKVLQRNGCILPQLLIENFVSTQTMLAPRRCLNEVGGFTPSLQRLHDWELAIRLADRFEFRIVDEPLVITFDTPGCLSKDVSAFVDSLATILNMHHAKFAQYPKVRASHLAFLGHCLCARGDLKNGRKYALHALRLKIGMLRAWISLLVSGLGRQTYRAVIGRRIPGNLND